MIKFQTQLILGLTVVLLNGVVWGQTTQPETPASPAVEPSQPQESTGRATEDERRNREDSARDRRDSAGHEEQADRRYPE